MQGLLLLNKPEGKTSFSAVAAVKRLAHEKKVGHTGTLDPMATGVLPIFLGRATALSGLLLDGDKRYIAGVKLGITTDTDDITGKVLTQNSVNVTDEQLQGALEHFVGKQEQIPPMYSAIKKDGVRMYALAREGKTVEITPRNIEIYGIKLLSALENNTFVIDVHVSKGTYIRSLARDIGEYLGCGATLTSLERIYAAGFDIENCVKLDDLTPENISSYILSEETAVKHFREIGVTDKQAVRFCNGGQLGFDRIKITDIKDGELFRVKYGEKLLGIGIADCEKQWIAIKCILNYPEGEGR